MVNLAEFPANGNSGRGWGWLTWHGPPPHFGFDNQISVAIMKDPIETQRQIRRRFFEILKIFLR